MEVKAIEAAVEAMRVAGKRPAKEYSFYDSGSALGAKVKVQVWELKECSNLLLALPNGLEFRTAQSKGVGEYLTAKVNGVEVMLTEGLRPNDDGCVQGFASIRAKHIVKEDAIRWELFVKFEPGISGFCRVLVLGDEPTGELAFGPDSDGHYVSLVRTR
jgi:hypothetical protein